MTSSAIKSLCIFFMALCVLLLLYRETKFHNEIVDLHIKQRTMVDPNKYPIKLCDQVEEDCLFVVYKSDKFYKGEFTFPAGASHVYGTKQMLPEIDKTPQNKNVGTNK